MCQAKIVAYCGAGTSPFGDIHMPYWAAKPCSGGAKIAASLTPATLASAVELSGLHAAATAILSGSSPSCSEFDLSRWGLLEFVGAAKPAGSGASGSTADAVARDRSRSPARAAKAAGKQRTQEQGRQRAGLEPAVIKLLRAIYRKPRDWQAVEDAANAIWWARPNIQQQVSWR